jgi:hypothetical protein
MSSPLEPTWQPLLTGELAAVARARIDELAVALAADRDDVDHPGLAGGLLGRAMFFAYRARLDDDEPSLARAEQLRDRAVDALAQRPLGYGLYSGFTGIGWVVEHFARDPRTDQPDTEGGDDDPIAPIDDALLDGLESPWTGDYELIRGLAGIGVHALERAHRPSGRAVLGRVIERLAERAESCDAGIRWKTQPEHLWPATRARHPDGYYNTGAAHGVPGVIVVLAGACAAGVEVARSRGLLDGALRWIQSCLLPDDAASAMPMWLRDDARSGPARAAWCYGDPGAAAALLAAARAVEAPAWEALALRIGRRAAARPLGGSGVIDAGLCHGSGGLAVVFHRLWHASREAGFADAARRWYAHVLGLHRPGAGVAGFESWLPEIAPEPARWHADATFLTGAAGVGLALLAGLGVEPAWDRLLAASLPRR